MVHAAFDNEHRLTTDRITKRKEGKVTIEVALLQSLKSISLSVSSLVTRLIAYCASMRTTGTEPVDYAMLSASTHGLIEGGAGGRRRGASNSEITEDDDVTITLSPTSLHPIPNATSSPIAKSSPTSIRPDDGKVIYTFVPNTPSAYSDLDRALPAAPFFQAEGLNVLSGETPLFAPEGLALSLRRYGNSHPILTIDDSIAITVFTITFTTVTVIFITAVFLLFQLLIHPESIENRHLHCMHN